MDTAMAQVSADAMSDCITFRRERVRRWCCRSTQPRRCRHVLMQRSKKKRMQFWDHVQSIRLLVVGDHQVVLKERSRKFDRLGHLNVIGHFANDSRRF